MATKIHDFEFSKEGIKEIKHLVQGENWPVVYILNNDSEAYVGETINAFHRAEQHLNNKERKPLKKMHIITNDDFNKSATLDVESSLIQLMDADKKFLMQNGNAGISSHHYNNMGEFRKESDNFRVLWEQLKKKKLVQNEIDNLVNSDLFKFSPYKALNMDQCAARDFIISDIADAFEKNTSLTTFVNGSAGTGKTILAIYLIKLLMGDDYLDIDEQDDVPKYIFNIKRIHNNKKDLQIAYVVAMTSLRETIGNVFKSIKGLSKSMVIAPSDVAKKHYDILIVDEAHRLKRPVGLGADIGSFYNTNQKLGFDSKEGTQLDWIIKSSPIQILFYDSDQSVKSSDIRQEDFEELHNGKNIVVLDLESQMRCIGGNDYIKYLKEIFNNDNPTYIDFSKRENKYEFKMFDDVNDMVDTIKHKNEQFGLCRNVAGYAWKWISKDKTPKEIKTDDLYDIQINGYKYYWNSTNTDWVNSSNAVNEIGCIHTVQGYDLNYCGVIIGNEITYNNETMSIELVKENYWDKKAYEGLSDKEILDNVKNIYVTLCTRGIRGTYVYVCDPSLRAYLKEFIQPL